MPDKKTIVYLCLEYAIEEHFPVYAGGLGILAGDLTREAGEQNLDWVSVGLFYNQGFHAHYLNQENLLDPSKVNFQILTDSLGKELTFSVPIGSDEVWFRVWVKSYQSAKLFLLDTNIAPNSESNKQITTHLYDSDRLILFKQQILLALGLPKILRSQNISPAIYHLNEGHTALAIITLAVELYHQSSNCSFEQCLSQISQQIVATKHTILTGGGLHLSLDQFQSQFGKYLTSENLPIETIFKLGIHPTHPNSFSTTNFLLRFACRESAVSLAHATAEKKVHPNSNLIPITNGINQQRWQAENLKNLAALSDAELWKAHLVNKVTLMNYLSDNFGRTLSKDVLTVVWARRFTSYKRPELLFSNLEELTKMTSLTPSIQFIVAGQTNPSDSDAQELSKRIQDTLKEKHLENRILFIPDYALTLALNLTRGADVWLNTPLPGLEASGTSGMKAGINGALELTTTDGWVNEVNWDNLGWLLHETNIANDLYYILEKQIIPMYYNIDQNKLPADWITRMRKNYSTNCAKLYHQAGLERLLREIVLSRPT